MYDDELATEVRVVNTDGHNAHHSPVAHKAGRIKRIKGDEVNGPEAIEGNNTAGLGRTGPHNNVHAVETHYIVDPHVGNIGTCSPGTPGRQR